VKEMIDKLIREVKVAAQAAYAPYSNFAVGAAILTIDGKIYTGCNVENASFGLTICAERVAITNAVKSGQRQFIKIAIYNDVQLAPPCGACLQVLSEFSPECEVILANANESRSIGTVKELLPHSFKFKL
jgi:cytidine deaminase